ncbi:MAG TPA: serine/threonine-protein kinase [Anaeromyxobacteraceae bacterium]|nr:serine/threonine-protein kinase [Anaeromyxobacteraceae bacterium]
MPEPIVQKPAFAPELLIGTTIDGRYRLTAHIASGGMGAVFRAEHVYMRKDVAVKVLRPELTAASEIVERFRREAEIAASLEHDNIVRVTDFGRSQDGYLFLIMEMLEGESLFDRTRRLGALPADEVVPILVQVCAGLEAAHRRGVVHRDLKPENVFLHRQPGGGTIVKILDFGIAKITDPTSASSTHPGMVVGTPEYLSPEQAMGSAIDARADLYAVGLIAWRVLAGRHPFHADDPRALLMMQATQPVPPLTEPRPDLAAWPALVSAVTRACAKAAGERHPSAADLGRELAACLGGEGRPLPSLRLVTGSPSPLPVESPTPPLTPSSRQSASLILARARSVLREAPATARRALRRAPGRLQAIWYRPRERRILFAAAAVLFLVGGLAGALAWSRQRPLIRAQALLDAGDAALARPLLEDAVAQRPGDARLRALLGRALHQLPDQAPAALDAYEAAASLDSSALVPAAVPDLVADLARERRLADRAARLLIQAGPGALPAVLEASREGPGFARLRALSVARDLGGEDRIDRAAAYGALLADQDCEVRKAASQRLGEIGAAEALPSLRALASAKVETRGFLGIKSSSPACGAAEAKAATRRIEASAPKRPSP